MIIEANERYISNIDQKSPIMRIYLLVLLIQTNNTISVQCNSNVFLINATCFNIFT